MANQTHLSLSTRAYIWATVVLFGLLAVSLTFYALGTRTPTASRNATNRSTAGTNESGAVAGVTTPPVAPEPERILSRTGEITRISANDIRFVSPVFDTQEGTYLEKELTAEVSTATVFYEIDRTTLPVPPTPGQVSTAKAPKLITRSDLRIGDIIDVSAAENIKGEMTFAAVEVNKILIR